MALTGMVELFVQAQSSRILTMSAVNDVTQGMHALLRVVIEPDPAPSLAVHEGDLFAGAQIIDRFRALCCGHAVGNTPAISPAIETENQPGLCWGSTMHKRIYAKRAMGPDETRISALEKLKPGPPH